MRTRRHTLPTINPKEKKNVKAKVKAKEKEKAKARANILKAMLQHVKWVNAISGSITANAQKVTNAIGYILKLEDTPSLKNPKIVPNNEAPPQMVRQIGHFATKL